jgi:hypothetical protein
MSAWPDFETINRVALSQARSLVPQWFPNGRLRGNEYSVGSIDGEPGQSFSINITTGQWGEFNGLGLAGGDLTSLYAHKFCGGDQGAAARELGTQLGPFHERRKRHRAVERERQGRAQQPVEAQRRSLVPDRPAAARCTAPVQARAAMRHVARVCRPQRRVAVLRQTV